MIELLLALHCFPKVVFGMETKIGEIKMRAIAAWAGAARACSKYIRGYQLDDTGPQAFPEKVSYLQIWCTNHGRRKVHERILIILAAQPGPNSQLFCLHSFKIF